MTDRDCSFSGCSNPVKAHRLCMGHYAQQRKGRPLTPLRPRRAQSVPDTARDDQGRKLCLKCQTYKPEADFTRDATRQDGLNIYCAVCIRSRHLLHSYGLTAEQYAAMLDEQGGACAACRAPAGDKPLHVDHDHACCPSAGKSCGKCVRALLCGPCNKALGFALEDAQRLRALADYAERWAP